MARTAKKAAFVMRHSDKSPAEIITEATKQGIKLSRSYIGKVRTARGKGRAAPPVRHIGKVTVKPQDNSAARAEFSQLVWRLGTVRVREWLAALDRETSRDDDNV